MESRFLPLLCLLWLFVSCGKMDGPAPPPSQVEEPSPRHWHPFITEEMDSLASCSIVFQSDEDRLDSVYFGLLYDSLFTYALLRPTGFEKTRMVFPYWLGDGDSISLEMEALVSPLDGRYYFLLDGDEWGHGGVKTYFKNIEIFRKNGDDFELLSYKDEDALDDLRHSARLDSIQSFFLGFDDDSFEGHMSFPRSEFDGYPDSIIMEIKYGHLFTNRHKHLFVYSPAGTFNNVEVFRQDKTGFSFILKCGYLYQDSIRDVNGDGLKDYVASWYPGSASHRVDPCNVYLARSANYNAFTEKIEFNNATFFPKERIIRGIGYGPPGSVGLYKLKWNGWGVDTVEYIYPTNEVAGDLDRIIGGVDKYGEAIDYRNESVYADWPYVKLSRRSFAKNTRLLGKLKRVPKEYQRLGHDYRYFMGEY